MLLTPFTLAECEEYFKVQGIVYSRYQMIESYMVLGGIPFYLSLMEKGKSLSQNIDMLCFSTKGPLRNEFDNLYASLFKYHENHVKIVETLAKKTKGMTREEILENSKLSDGGTITKTLAELQECGFIYAYKEFGKKSKPHIYQLVDPYTLFYLNFIKGNKSEDEHYWSNMIDNSKHRAWSGYAFEQVCLAHIKQIKIKLGISGIIAPVSSWISKRIDKKMKGAQIDLLIDRNDNLINICEMKYSRSEFIIDKQYDADLRNKKDVFIRETGTKKGIHTTMVTTYGARENEYYGNIQSEVIMDDLFK